MENVKVKVLPGGHMPERHGDWFDLATAEDCTLKAGESAVVSLGVCIGLPVGYEALLAPRSSTFKKWGLLQTNSVGVIDNAYCGDDDVWGWPCYATRAVTVPAGTRICQFRIQRTQPHCVLVPVECMSTPSRGGFGSTGEQVEE